MVFVLVSRVTIWTFFFFNDTATTEIYTLSLHDALPICCCLLCCRGRDRGTAAALGAASGSERQSVRASERASDHFFHDFAGAAVDPLHARIRVHADDHVFVHVPVPAIQLHDFVEHPPLPSRP